MVMQSRFFNDSLGFRFLRKLYALPRHALKPDILLKKNFDFLDTECIASNPV